MMLPFASLVLESPYAFSIFIFKFRYKIFVSVTYSCCYTTTDIFVIKIGIAVKPYPPLMGIFRVLNNLSSLTPPVFSLLIMSYFYYSHPGKMGSCHHIGKAGIFVCCRDCRGASVPRLWDGFSFFAYPLFGGVSLLFFILYYLRFDTCVMSRAYTWGYSIRVVYHSVLLTPVHLTDYQAPQRLSLRTPPRTKLARLTLK